MIHTSAPESTGDPIVGDLLIREDKLVEWGERA